MVLAEEALRAAKPCGHYYPTDAVLVERMVVAGRPDYNVLLL